MGAHLGGFRCTPTPGSHCVSSPLPAWEDPGAAPAWGPPSVVGVVALGSLAGPDRGHQQLCGADSACAASAIPIPIPIQIPAMSPQGTGTVSPGLQLPLSHVWPVPHCLTPGASLSAPSSPPVQDGFFLGLVPNPSHQFGMMPGIPIPAIPCSRKGGKTWRTPWGQGQGSGRAVPASSHQHRTPKPHKDPLDPSQNMMG